MDFHTVRFSGSSGWFLFLNLPLSFFLLCEEAKCIYLCLHLAQKSTSYVWTRKTNQVGLGYISWKRYVMLTDYKKNIITKSLPIIFLYLRCFSQGGISESPRVFVKMFSPRPHLKFTKPKSLREGWEHAF